MIVPPTTVTVASTTLYHLAAEAYRDPSLWTLIAAANRLSDPWVTGITTLTIPRNDSQRATGGVLGG